MANDVGWNRSLHALYFPWHVAELCPGFADWTINNSALWPILPYHHPEKITPKSMSSLDLFQQFQIEQARQEASEIKDEIRDRKRKTQTIEERLDKILLGNPSRLELFKRNSSPP